MISRIAGVEQATRSALFNVVAVFILHVLIANRSFNAILTKVSIRKSPQKKATKSLLHYAALNVFMINFLIPVL